MEILFLLMLMFISNILILNISQAQARARFSSPNRGVKVGGSSSSSSSSGGSSGGSSSSSSSKSLFGTYDVQTQTYTSPSGEKQSMALSNVPAGTSINFGKSTSSSSSSGGGKSSTSAKANTTTTQVKAVRDAKGNLVGYDTGTQSVPATAAEKAADAKVRKYATSQEKYYQERINKKISSISNWSQLSPSVKQDIINKETAKANKSYQQSVGGYQEAVFSNVITEQASKSNSSVSAQSSTTSGQISSFSSSGGGGSAESYKIVGVDTNSRGGIFSSLIKAENAVYNFLEEKTPSYSSILGINTTQIKEQAPIVSAQLKSQEVISFKDSAKIMLLDVAKYLPESTGGAAFRGAEAAGVYYAGSALLSEGAAVYATLPARAQAIGSAAMAATEVYFTYEGVTGAINKQNPYRLGSAGLGIVSAASLTARGVNVARDVKIAATRTEVATETLVPADVLSGEKKFVESYSYGYKGPASGSAKVEFDTKIFQERGKGYHATPSAIKSSSLPEGAGKGFVTQGSSSEFEGLYIASDVSPHFLKVTAGEKPKVSFLPEISKPQVLEVAPQGFVKGTSAKEGFAFVPGIKPEIEAVIPKGTTLVKQESGYYFKYGRRNVPIDVFTTKAGKTSTNLDQVVSKEFASKYSLPRSSVSSSTLMSSVSFAFYSRKGKGSLLSQLNYSSFNKSPFKGSAPSFSFSRSRGGGSVPTFSIPSLPPTSSVAPAGSSGISAPSKIPTLPSGSGGSSLMRSTINMQSGGLFGNTFFGTKQANKLTQDLFPQPQKYQSSIYAAAFNIKSIKIPKSYLRGAGAISVRPILTGNKRRKKKK